MPHCRSSHVISLRAALAVAFASLLAPAAASAQWSQLPTVRVTNDKVEVQSNLHAQTWTVLTAEKGQSFEVFYVEGDRYAHRDDNWYWVILPRDPTGARQAGWISGRDVAYIPAPPVAPARAMTAETDVVRPAAVATSAADATRGVRPSDAPRPAATNAPAAATASRVEVSEVVVNFAFDKSDLSDEAKGRLDRAAAMLKTQSQGVSFALEGHADAMGAEPYNQKLGLARAKAVGQYLAEHHQIPEAKISTASRGEAQPAASNATDEGRAENRRVVIKVGP